MRRKSNTRTDFQSQNGVRRVNHENNHNCNSFCCRSRNNLLRLHWRNNVRVGFSLIVSIVWGKRIPEGGQRMTWDDFQQRQLHINGTVTRIKTDIECPKCGKYIWKRLDIVLTSIPPQYQYECDDCGWTGYHTI